MSDKVDKETIGLSPTTLQGMLTAILQEARKPLPPTSEQVIEVEQAQRMRKEQAQFRREEFEQRRRLQLSCTHKHRTGESHCVFITNASVQHGNYIICQKCQAHIRPTSALPKAFESDIVDPQLYNELFQSIGMGDFE